MHDMGDGDPTDPLTVLARDGRRPATSDDFADDVLAPLDQVED
jgi:hypothetical protein